MNINKASLNVLAECQKVTVNTCCVAGLGVIKELDTWRAMTRKLIWVKGFWCQETDVTAASIIFCHTAWINCSCYSKQKELIRFSISSAVPDNFRSCCKAFQSQEKKSKFQKKLKFDLVNGEEQIQLLTAIY